MALVSWTNARALELASTGRRNTLQPGRIRVGNDVASRNRSVNDACPRQDSNLRFRLRRATLYPLSYGGALLCER